MAAHDAWVSVCQQSQGCCFIIHSFVSDYPTFLEQLSFAGSVVKSAEMTQRVPAVNYFVAALQWYHVEVTGPCRNGIKPYRRRHTS